MKNYAKQQTDVFCTGQTLILCSDGHDLLYNESDHSELIGARNLVPKTRGFEYVEITIQRLENEI
jgi:hypothetical protein